jgi:transmembrane sensor
MEGNNGPEKKHGREYNIRLFLKRIRARLRPPEPAQRFPVEEGWVELKARIESGQHEEPGAYREEKTGASIRIISLRYAAVAAVVLVLSVGGLWVMRKASNESHPIAGNGIGALRPAKGVELILSNGQHVAVNKPETLKENGISIHLDSGGVAYQPNASANTVMAGINILVVPRGNKSRIVLPDGTRVWVNAQSKLTYPSAFQGPDREVQVDGEAYFDVSKDPAHPFIVHAGAMDIKVLGTAFNVNAYDPVLSTTLVNGKISINAGNTQTILKPGDQATFDSGNGSMRISNVNPGDYTAWKDDNLYIGNGSLEQVVETLGRMYDYEIVLSDASLKELHFTLDMPAPKTMKEALDHICSTTEGLGYTISGRTVTFSRIK